MQRNFQMFVKRVHNKLCHSTQVTWNINLFKNKIVKLLMHNVQYYNIQIKISFQGLVWASSINQLIWTCFKTCACHPRLMFPSLHFKAQSCSHF